MKTSFITESVLYWIVRGISSAAQLLPPRVSAGFGAALGRCAFCLLPRRRKIALTHLRAAFGDRTSPSEYQRIIRKMFEHFGMTILEIAQIPRMDQRYVERWVEIPPGSLERLDTALLKGKGVILLTGHFGNWEMISITGALKGYPTLLLARQQGWPRLNELLNQYRQSKGCQIISKGFAIRELIRGLQQKKIVGILSDQDGGMRGVLAPFFGRLASTAPGAIQLSLETGAPIVPIFIIRKNGPEHRLILEEPLVIPAEGSLEERTRAGVAAYLTLLEKHIRHAPHQWLWLHRRWKSTPERKILIFTDGKAGHIAQSQAVAQRIEAAWTIRTQADKRLPPHPPALVQTRLAPIVFRHAFWRPIVAIAATCRLNRLFGENFWLRSVLTKESYRGIRSSFADISISCGSSLAAVHLLWAEQIRTRTIHIHRSRWPSWRRFDLSFIPRHDQGASHEKKVYVTNGALTPLNGAGAGKLWVSKLNLQKHKQIGVLIGGPARGIELSLQSVQDLVRHLLAAADEVDAELLVTTSRRTPASIEAWLQNTLKHDPRCRLLVLVNQKQTNGLSETRDAIPCIFETAQAIVTSGDSVSMVSEAVATGKPVFSFLPSSLKMWGTPKHHRFLRQMEAKNLLHLVSLDKISEAVIHTFRSASSAPVSARPAGQDKIVEFFIRWL